MPTVLITGTNRGLGLEFARQYAANGWTVLACCRRVSPDLATLGRQSSRIAVHEMDVSDHASIDALAGKLKDQAIDVLLNNAGYFGSVPFPDGGLGHQSFGHSDFGNWMQVLRINLFGPMKMTEAFIAHVERSRQRKIITLSSIVGSMALNSSGGMYAYRTSKAAVNMLMRSLAIDLADRGVLAVALHPGWVRTDMGGGSADLDATESVASMIALIDRLDASSSGQFLNYDGSVLPN